MSLPDGSRLGPYRIIRKLGEGGMGAVYEALHEAIERRVAIKILHPELSRQPELAARFIDEARIVNRIAHPGLVQIFDYSHDAGGRAYIVMEYLAGENLTARLHRRGGRLPVREAVPLFQRLGSALLAAHEKGVTHRDLKPDNVMLVADREHPDGERLKLLDFGLAKLEGRGGTRGDLLMGTPQYMSPEQCRGARTITDKSDVYSFGVMLYEALAGRLPFSSPEVGELLSMHMHTDVPPLSGYAPEVPEKLAALVAQLLQKAPESRPGIAQVQTLLAESIEAAPRSRPPAEDPTPSGVATLLDAYHPTLVAAAPGPFLAAAELRKLLEEHLVTDGAFEAFLADYFPALKRRFPSGLEAAARAKLLEGHTDRQKLAAALRSAVPSAFLRLLLVTAGPDEGRLYPLPASGEVVIGRGVESDIRLEQDLDDRMVSRRHAVLELWNRDLFIRLLGKRPFLVNGQPVHSRSLLVSGDQIAIGSTQFTLETAFRSKR